MSKGSLTARCHPEKCSKCPPQATCHHLETSSGSAVKNLQKVNRVRGKEDEKQTDRDRLAKLHCQSEKVYKDEKRNLRQI